MMAIIGGVERHLGAWKPSRLKLQGVMRSDINVAALPMVYVIPGVPTDYDQGQLGSCGPNSVAEVYDFDHKARFSRLFLYWFTRATEGDAFVDGGVEIPDLLAVASSMGMPLETVWPYDIAAFEAAPSLAALVAAQAHRVERWDVVPDLDHLLFELTQNQPVTFGFNVPASMQTDECASTGLVAVPSATDPAIGGHCVNAIGFDRDAQLVRCTCHYGGAFGSGGTILLPFAHFTSGNASDLSAIRSIS